jgi:hypothetical protein
MANTTRPRQGRKKQFIAELFIGADMEDAMVSTGLNKG